MRADLPRPDVDDILGLLSAASPTAGPSAAGPPTAHPRAAGPPVRRTGAPPSPGTLVERSDVSGSVARFRIRLDVPISIRPGQYVTLGLRVAGRGTVARPYSVAAGGTDAAELEFLIRRVPSGSLTPALWRLRPGASIDVGRPKGLFTLDPADGRPHLFVATGTGLAPLVAMSRALLADRPRSTAILVHGVSFAGDLAYRRELEAWAKAYPAFRYEPVVSRSGDAQDGGWRGRTGRIPDVLPDLMRVHGLDPGATVAYLCGNPAMITSATERLAAVGMDLAAIRSERYWTPAPGA